VRFKLVSAVHLFLLRHEQEVLLLRRFNTGYEDGNYSIVAGHLDGGETVKEAMIREAREEIGVDIAGADLEVVHVMHRLAGDERIDFFLRADRWSGEVKNMEPHKCSDLAWYPLDALPDNMIAYVKKAFNNYQDRTWFDSYGWPKIDL